MKKLVFITIITAAIFSGCVKQKNCDCDMTGKFVYFENGEEIIHCHDKRKINAVVLSQGTTEDQLLYGDDYSRYHIVGSIPKEFRTNDTVNVRFCLSKEKNKGLCLAIGVYSVYKLKCIEKED